MLTASVGRTFEPVILLAVVNLLVCFIYIISEAGRHFEGTATYSPCYYRPMVHS